MQVLLNIPEVYFDDEFGFDFSSIEKERISRAYDLRDCDEVEFVNIGPGADWIVLLTTFANVAWVLFQGPGILKKVSKDGNGSSKSSMNYLRKTC